MVANRRYLEVGNNFCVWSFWYLYGGFPLKMMMNTYISQLFMDTTSLNGYTCDSISAFVVPAR